MTYASSCTVPSVSTYAEYYLGMIVDPDREVDETDETDNTTYSSSTVIITA